MTKSIPFSTVSYNNKYIINSYCLHDGCSLCLLLLFVVVMCLLIFFFLLLFVYCCFVVVCLLLENTRDKSVPDGSDIFE